MRRAFVLAGLVLAGLVATLGAVPQLGAQQPPFALDARAAAAPAIGPRRLLVAAPQQTAPFSPLLATTSSLVLPGMGQLLMEQRRWTAYAGLELAGWVVHLDRLRSGRRYRTTYRDLAWVAARGMPQPRAEGAWEYYEAMGSWHRSGAFDDDAARMGVQPEMDGESYNGSIWELAQDLYLPPGADASHPAYARALAYYERRAIRADFVWDWSGREDSLQLYRELIDKSDGALRTASVVLGAVVANHLFSAVDAFVSSRLASAPPVRASVSWREGSRGTALQWTVQVRP